jgi:uncharacterized protein YoxC
MKVTKEYLQQVINEEIQQMIEEGEIDEGVLDALKGAGSAIAGKLGGAAQAVGKAVSSKAEAVSQAVQAAKVSAAKHAQDIITAAKTASTKGDIQSTMSSLTSDVASASKALATLQAKAKQLAGVDVSPLMASLNQVTAQMQTITKQLSAAPAAATAPADAEAAPTVQTEGKKRR